MYLLREVEKFLRETQMPITAFGRNAMNDPRFVFDLRKGRELRPKTEQKVRRYMERHRNEQASSRS